VQGFLDLTSQLAVGADFVVLAFCMRGIPLWGAYVDVEIVYQLRWSFYCIRFFHIFFLL
jgi:hypothetical protein